MERKRHRSWLVNFICILTILCMFAIAGLMLTGMGVGVYQKITVNNLENFRLRTSLSFVATKMRQLDKEDAVYLSEKDGTKILVMDSTENNVAYETILYFYEGKLYEQYQEKGFEYSLSGGQAIADLKEFKVEERKDGLFELTAVNLNDEEQNLLIHLRSVK